MENESVFIGDMLKILRVRADIKRKEVCRGICDLKLYSRFERGERIPDKLMADALLQRLGKSPNKLETIFTERDYSLCMKREEISCCLLKNDFEKVESLLGSYSRTVEKSEKFHQQYIYKIKAILAGEKKDLKEQYELLRAAIEMTLPDFQVAKMQEYLYSLEELNLLLMLALNCSDTNEDMSEALLEGILSYLDQSYTDEEEKVKVYPQAVCIASKLYIKKEKYKEMTGLCKKALDMMARNSVICCQAEIFKLYLIGLKHENKEEAYCRIEKQAEAFWAVSREFGYSNFFEKELSLQSGGQSEIALVNEVIKNGRVAIGLSQEELADGICAVETVSRLENGKRKPVVWNFESLMERIGMDRDFFNLPLTTDEFEVFEKQREIKRLITLRSVEEAEKEFLCLQPKIREDSPRNRQFLMYMRTLFDYRFGRIGEREALKQYTQALNQTLKGYDILTAVKIPLSRDEIRLLNNIAILYNRLGEKETAIQILNGILEGFRQSKIASKYHLGSLLVMRNLSAYLEETGKLMESIALCDEAIGICFQSGRDCNLADFLMNKAYALERLDEANGTEEHKNTCQQYYQQAFYISDFIQDTYINNIVRNHYANKYESNKIWY